jgi:hypothetical protein
MRKRLVGKREWSKIRKNPIPFQTLLPIGLLRCSESLPPEMGRCFLYFKKKNSFFSDTGLKNQSFTHKILFGKKLRTANIDVEQYLV